MARTSGSGAACRRRVLRRNGWRWLASGNARFLADGRALGSDNYSVWAVRNAFAAQDYRAPDIREAVPSAGAARLA